MKLINSIVQVNEYGPDEWFGCLVQVTKSGKDWIIGYIKQPGGEVKHVKLEEDQYYFIGMAILTKK